MPDLKRGVSYINRALLFSPYCIGLCLSEAAFKKELRRLKLPPEKWPSFLGSDKAGATTHVFESKDVVMVAMGSRRNCSMLEIHGLLVHEAVHIWQAIRDSIGEKSPSAEFEAYSLQTISQNLFEAYRELTRKCPT